MKRQILHKMMLGMFLMLLAVGMAYAQNEGQIFRATIPFSFSVGTHSYPAGDYTLQPMRQHASLTYTMILRNQRGEILANFLTNSLGSGGAVGTAKLVFNRYGGRYFLAEARQAGNNIGWQLIKSPSEIEVAKAMRPSGELVAVNLATH